MPKKQNKETPGDQAARFRAEVERMIAAGELNPTEAEGAFEQTLINAAPLRSPTPPSGS